MTGTVRQKGRADFSELFIGGVKVTPGEGGGGAAIQPETGSSPIKISAFPNAATNMASGDTVTGLQGGANVNFSQAQLGAGQLPVYTATTGTAVAITAGAGNPGANLIWQAGHATAASNGIGGTLYINAGNGDGSGAGGYTFFYGGKGGVTGDGGGMTVSSGYGGTTSGNAGNLQLLGGHAYTGNGGNVYVRGGVCKGMGKTGGSVEISAGSGSVGATDGFIKLIGLPTADPSSANATWVDHGILVQSGITNFSGTITAADITTKNFTVVNGIITAFA